MPGGIYIRTKEILAKQSNSHKGKIPWNKGKKMSLESRIKTSVATKKAMTSQEIRNKISISKIGKKMPEGTGQKISLANRGKTKGSKHYNWKGGRVEVGNKIRKCFEYRQWRSDIFTKNNFTCQDCGVRGGELQVHHIKAFSIILEKNNIKTFEEALICSELWDINNGITLCIPCHKETESYAVNKKWLLDK